MFAARRIAVLLLVALTALPAFASTATEIPVRVTKRPVEESPAMGPGFIAWHQAGDPNSLRTTVYAEAAGQPAFRVHSKGSYGRMGGIDGSRLVYSSYRGLNREGELVGGDIRMYDLATRTPLPVPSGINTNAAEIRPSMSGDWLLFGRLSGAKRPKVNILLRNLQTTETRSVTANGFPGQVNGDFAVWMACGRRSCNVFRYEITTQTTLQIPNPDDKLQYTPGVASDGTVYFSRSGFGCGTNALFQKWSPAAGTSLLVDFPKGVDGGDAFVYDGSGTGREILYARFRCLPDKYEPTPSDLYKIVE